MTFIPKDKIYYDEIITIDPDPSELEQKLKKHESIGRIEHYLREVFHNIRSAFSNLNIFLPKMERLKLNETRISKAVDKISGFSLENKKKELINELNEVNDFLKGQKSHRTMASGIYSELPENQRKSKLDKKTKIENQLRYIDSKLDRNTALQTELKSIQKELNEVEKIENANQEKLDIIEKEFDKVFNNADKCSDKDSIEKVWIMVIGLEKELREQDKREVRDRLYVVKSILKDLKSNCVYVEICKLERKTWAITASEKNLVEKLKVVEQTRQELEQLASTPDYKKSIKKNSSHKEKADKIYMSLRLQDSELRKALHSQKLDELNKQVDTQVKFVAKSLGIALDSTVLQFTIGNEPKDRYYETNAFVITLMDWAQNPLNLDLIRHLSTKVQNIQILAETLSCENKHGPKEKAVYEINQRSHQHSVLSELTKLIENINLIETQGKLYNLYASKKTTLEKLQNQDSIKEKQQLENKLLKINNEIGSAFNALLS